MRCQGRRPAHSRTGRAVQSATAPLWPGGTELPAQASPDPGHVEPDDSPLRIQRVDKWAEHLQADSNAITQEQGRPGWLPGPYGGPQYSATDAHIPHVLGRVATPTPTRYHLVQSIGLTFGPAGSGQDR